MLAKLTVKHQLTLPKSVISALGPVEYFDVKALKGKIVLTPVRIPHGDTVRAKLAGLRLTEADICAAVASARAGVAANARAKPRRKA